jgi:hypothetical protein
MGLEMVAFKVVIAGNTIEVVTLGDAKAALRKQKSDLERQKEKSGNRLARGQKQDSNISPQ